MCYHVQWYMFAHSIILHFQHCQCGHRQEHHPSPEGADWSLIAVDLKREAFGFCSSVETREMLFCHAIIYNVVSLERMWLHCCVITESSYFHLVWYVWDTSLNLNLSFNYLKIENDLCAVVIGNSALCSLPWGDFTRMNHFVEFLAEKKLLVLLLAEKNGCRKQTSYT